MFISFEKNDCESDCITFGDNSQGKVLDFGKIVITTEHLISKVLLVESLEYNLLSFHNFVRWITIACSPIRVCPSLGEMMVPLSLKMF
jgi:hypothetical protein